MRREASITWEWAEAGRGALTALPAAVIMLAVDVSLGIVFALGTLPVAMLGVPPRRGQRPRLGLAGLAFAASYALGSVLGLQPVVAVAALAVLAYAGVLFSVRKPTARLLPGMMLPALALGMNHPAPDGLIVAAVMLAGCGWATLITYCWPQTHPPAIAATPPRQEPDPAAARRATHIYAVLFTAAAGLGLALGYLLGLVHVAWAAAAAMFIMRPDPDLLTSRAVGRTVATFAGVVAAGLLLRRGPTEIALAAVTVAAIAAMIPCAPAAGTSPPQGQESLSCSPAAPRVPAYWTSPSPNGSPKPPSAPDWR
jgi:fusaric acid resistance family protein